ncbi:hypothetical protein M529_02640 [Sphingobium ummariense RL-3]|uniref:Transposase n=1 Tax=Sphingobium ummariense RL-3 TaxID=1346791 RepID=T0KKS2_9SPHN|nr:hypothetical protein M529_02640 [Sphingobium ummariense RL-3]
MAVQPGFFDLSDRYEALSAAGDPLERLSAVVDFELFRGLNRPGFAGGYLV